jgi:hypothetical protein
MVEIMRTNSRMSGLVESIMASHDARVNSINDIRKEVSAMSEKTQVMMEGYREEHKWRAVDWAKIKEFKLKKPQYS